MDLNFEKIPIVTSRCFPSKNNLKQVIHLPLLSILESSKEALT